MSVTKKLAVLIDADNISAECIAPILQAIQKFGTPTIKRLYGDWSNAGMNAWKTMLLPHAITPIQQFSYTKGKNATDIAMVIDAMDLLYQGKIDGFCLISSDSDFTKLALRIRENGLSVFGFGEQKTPPSLTQACTEFTYIESILPQKIAVTTQQPQSTSIIQNTPKIQAKSIAKKTVTTSKTKILDAKTLLPIIEQALKERASNHQWVTLETIRADLKKSIPDFDCKHYGFSKLFKLIKAFPDDFSLVLNGNIYSIKLKNTPKKPIIKTDIVLSNQRASAEQLNANKDLIALIHQCIQKHSNDEGWASLGPVTSAITKAKLKPYGYTKASSLFKEIQSIRLQKIANIYHVKII